MELTNFKRNKQLLSWGVFALSFIAYFLTAQQSVMFWDSGEFIASTYKLQATHPPGAPLYTLISRLFIAALPAGMVAFGCALFSALCGSATVYFLFLAIVWLGEKLMVNTKSEQEGGQWAILASATVGALALSFSDSFWVSSTEAEVYTLSTFFMALAFWAATQWERHFGEAGNFRWLLLIVFVMGLSIGVHILNLALLFPVALMIVLKQFGFDWKRVAIGLVAALFLFFMLNSGLVQGLLRLLIKFEIKGVNDWGLAQHQGALIGIALFAATLTFGLWIARRQRRFWLEKALLCITVFSIGWSSYVLVVIRTDAETPTSNNGDDVVRLLDYLRSDQFGFSDRPLFYGPVFNAPLDGDKPYVNGPVITVFDEEQGKYVVTNDGKLRQSNFHDDAKMYFPRMHSSDALDVIGYRQWVDFRGRMTALRTVKNGQTQNLVVPTMSENLSFFFTYQLGWLNYRYFMWNFAGRQNDTKGKGIPAHGNWYSGIPLIDNGRVGSSDARPEVAESSESKNAYFMLPLLLGLIGAIFLFYHAKSELTITALFFLAFGVAITIFINQLPIHVLIRERDYIFLGAYYAFCMWIGVGVYGLFYWIKLQLPQTSKALLVGGLCLLLVPGLMAFQGWDDHDRTLDEEARILAKNMLDQCEANGILISSGDNVTFPIWYMQEVEGYRTDVRLLDYNLMGLEWYIDRMKKRLNDAPAIDLSLPTSFYQHGKTSIIPLQRHPNVKSHQELKSIIDFLKENKGRRFIPTDLFKMSVDSAAMVQKGLDAGRYNAKLVPEIRWQLTKGNYLMRDVVMMDMLTQNQFRRPIYFANTGVSQFNMGLEDYFVTKGLVNQLLPIEPILPESSRKLVDIQSLNTLLLTRLSFDAYKNPDRFVNGYNADFAVNVYRSLFTDLAYAYGELGEMMNCVGILDQAQRMMPNESVPYREEVFTMATMYYNGGAAEEGRNVMRKIMGNLMDQMHWFISFEPQHPIITYDEVSRIGNEMTRMMGRIAELDPDLAAELDVELQDLSMRFNDWIVASDVISRRHGATQGVPMSMPEIPQGLPVN